MRASDLSTVNKIADKVHSLTESADVFNERFALFPQGCFVLRHGKQVVGYAITHPWKFGYVPALDSLIDKLPSEPNCLFLHDVAILPRFRRHKALTILMRLLFKGVSKLRLDGIALVAVYETDSIWRRFKFAEIADARLTKKLTAYGDTARYMMRVAKGRKAITVYMQSYKERK